MLAKHIAKIIFIEYKVNLLALDYKIIFMSIWKFSILGNLVGLDFPI